MMPQMLPKIISNKNNGIGILSGLGMDRNFPSEMYKKYGTHASKLGLSDSFVKNAVGFLENNLIGNAENNQQPNQPTQTASNASRFDKNKYPKIG